MNACTANSAIQLLAAASTYLIIVVWLEMFWVRSPKSCMATTLPSRSGSGHGSTPSSQPEP
jgi:hypothetical protein